MAVVRVNGKPDAFVTFTCNPKWTEITENLRPGELPWMRPDLLNRVFKMKLDSLLKDLRESKDVPGYLGEVVAYLHVIEFQKRGLPHAHILLIFKSSEKLRTENDVDRMVCAEIPNPILQPLLFETVSACMLHGPCGAARPSCPCMKDGKCTKQFPKERANHTILEDDTFPT